MSTTKSTGNRPAGTGNPVPKKTEINKDTQKANRHTEDEPRTQERDTVVREEEETTGHFNDPGRIDRTQKPEETNDPTRIRKDANDPEKTDPTRIKR